MKLRTEEILAKFSKDGSHPHEVRRIALLLFDELNRKVKEMPPQDRKILESAALLHDIGYYVEAKSHNKHSRRIILENGLDEFSLHDTKLVACIARFHRGSLPDKEKHDFYAEFEKKDRKRIKRLAGILRVADGLDGSHLSAIKKITVNYDEENNIIEIYLTPETPEFRPDITAAIRKRDLLEIGFKFQSVLRFSNF